MILVKRGHAETNSLGSTRALVSSAGVLVQSIDYDSFGKPIVAGTPSTRYLYTGWELDAESGLFYYRARYYDSSTGRFTNEDPIGFAGGSWNTQIYVDNSPISWVDPYGLFQFGKRPVDGSNWQTDVRAFHEAVISNRRSQLQGEIDDARSRLVQRRSQMDVLDVRRREIMNMLSSYGALEQMLKLQSELSRLQAEVLELRKRLELAVQVEEKKTELTIERARIQQELFRDIRHHDAEIREAILIFEDLSRRISDHEGSLQISATENGPMFKVVVEGGRSVGIRNMQIFCFDMMLAVLWSKRKLGPGFLIHDSHLFDGMD